MIYRQHTQVLTAMILHSDFLPRGCFPGTKQLVMTILLAQSIGWCIQCIRLLLFTSPYFLLILGLQTKFLKAFFFFLFVNFYVASVRVQAENKKAVKLGNLRRI